MLTTTKFTCIPGDDQYEEGLLPYIDYYFEDKSQYPTAQSQGYVDVDGDYLIGESTGFLMNMNFIFIGTDKFSETAQYYEIHKRYCEYPVGTKGYINFWTQETERRRKGMTLRCKLLHKDIDEYFDSNTTEARQKQLLHPLHITGDHYNYLNYGRIMRTPSEDELREIKRVGSKATLVQGFPRFWDGDYWNFKFDEFLAKNGFHGAKAKARRKGYSFKRGSQGANTVNLNRNITIIMAAYDIAYLTDPGATSDMIKTNLDWYETKTYWKRGYLSEPLDSIELGYKEQSQGNKKFGWRSKSLSVTLRNNPSAPIGKGAIEIDYEEAGKCPNLQRSLELAMSVTESGSLSVGTIRVYGTAGDADADWVDFSRIFYAPKANKMMPLENIYDKDARYETCGFFHPQILNYEPYLDAHGNSLLVKAYKADLQDKKWAEKNKDTASYLMYVGQRANSPEEAFTIGKENIFSSSTLVEHFKDTQAHSGSIVYRDGLPVRTDKGVVFKTNVQLKEEGLRVHSYIENVPFKKDDDLHGCFREYHPPRRIDGVIPTDLYYGTMDQIGKDKDAKEITTKNSLNVIQIWMYPNNIIGTGDILCSQYAGRFGEMSDANELFRLELERYNAKGLPEVDRGTTVADFKRWQCLNLLYRDPTSIINESQKDNSNASYGICIGSTYRAEEGLFNLKDMLYTQCGIDEDSNPKYVLHYIRDLPFLKELLQFSNKGNFDRISCARVATFQRLAYRTKRKRPSNPQGNKTILGSIGLYNRK